MRWDGSDGAILNPVRHLVRWAANLWPMSKIGEPRINWLLELARGIGVAGGEAEQLRLPRIMLAMLMTVVGTLAVGWASIYAIFDEPLAASLPLAYVGLSAVLILVMRRTGGIALVLQAQLVLIVFVPFLVAVTLGGFVASSGVVPPALAGALHQGWGTCTALSRSRCWAAGLPHRCRAQPLLAHRQPDAGDQGCREAWTIHGGPPHRPSNRPGAVRRSNDTLARATAPAAGRHARSG